jgi:proteasome accessory factor C
VVGRRSSVVENRVITTPACDSIRQGLRRAIDRQDVVTIAYDRGGQGDWSTRTVRPLALEQHADVWYLRAYCLLRNAERTFRVDRIGDQIRNGAATHPNS